MRVSIRTLIAAAFLFSSSVARAQSAVDPSGHWTGIVKVPDHPLDIEVDLVRRPSGELAGTFAQPEQGIKALPLLSVAAEARTVRFVVKGSDQASAFTGVVTGDGKTLSGEVAFAQYVFPFTLTRIGDAHLAAAPISPAIGKELEGTWRGTIVADGRSVDVEFRMANRPDGTSTGTAVSQSGTGVEIPVVILQAGSNVTLSVDAVGASFSGELNAAGTELAGAWRQNTLSLPLILMRAQ